ncbi:MAG: hypothetical protein HQL22_07800 [Candidatus Omnitrophica bacterium]|nr:hypothetical protein [Candidatus Omnitrophota bacterium]
MKHKALTPVQKLLNQTLAFTKQNPLAVGIVAVSIVIVLSWYIAALRAGDFLPEAQKARMARQQVIDKGDTMSWLGMEVTPISRMIRKEFRIPGKINGVFVISEGTQQGLKYGMKTGDVIVSINRRPVRNQREFIQVADDVRFGGGILLDVYRSGQELYVTIPFEYQYGPLLGPNQGSWQLGSPVFGQALPYGPVVK